MRIPMQTTPSMPRASRKTLRTIGLSVVLTLLAAFTLSMVPSRAAWSQAGQAAPIVDAAHVVAARQRDAILWDVRAANAYAKGHIPGAVNIGDVGQVLRNANTEDFIATERIARLWGEAGIDPTHEIIVYATRGNAAAYFAQFALRHFGATKVSVYHDGIDGWRQAGHPLDTTSSKRAPVALTLRPVPQLTVSTDEMVSRIKDANLQIIDARTVGEFAGDDVRAIRGGHIPGAINIPYEHNWIDPATAIKLARRQVADNRGMSLKPDPELQALYAKLDPNKETIVYCQSGVRAAETAAVLEKLGFRNVRVYDSSWLGYAARLNAPVQNEVFFNVGALNGRIAAMQARIDALEKELSETRRGAPK